MKENNAEYFERLKSKSVLFHDDISLPNEPNICNIIIQRLTLWTKLNTVINPALVLKCLNFEKSGVSPNVNQLSNIYRIFVRQLIRSNATKGTPLITIYVKKPSKKVLATVTLTTTGINSIIESIRFTRKVAYKLKTQVQPRITHLVNFKIAQINIKISLKVPLDLSKYYPKMSPFQSCFDACDKSGLPDSKYNTYFFTFQEHKYRIQVWSKGIIILHVSNVKLKNVGVIEEIVADLLRNFGV